MIILVTKWTLTNGTNMKLKNFATIFAFCVRILQENSHSGWTGTLLTLLSEGGNNDRSIVWTHVYKKNSQ